MKHLPTVVIPLLLAAGLAGGCAIANRGEFTLVRNISFGQELMDLKAALDQGAISEPEYVTLKAKLMAMLEEIDVVATVNDYTPDKEKQD